jgi:hypothetical protein
VNALRREHADVVPFLGALWTSVVAGAFAERGGDPFSTITLLLLMIVSTLEKKSQQLYEPKDRRSSKQREQHT